MNTLYRILAGICMVCLIAWGYWWLTLAVGILFLFLFKNYYEIIIWGILFDVLYGGSSEHATFLAIVLLFVGIYLKKRLSVYR